MAFVSHLNLDAGGMCAVNVMKSTIRQPGSVNGESEVVAVYYWQSVVISNAN